MVELLKVTWLVQTMQGLVATKAARVCVRWGGQEDGMSSDHRDLQLYSLGRKGGGTPAAFSCWCEGRRAGVP